MKNLIGPFVGFRLVLIERATGKHTTLARKVGLMVEAFSARFSAGAAYWIDDATGELVCYDVAAKTRQAVPLDEVAP